MSNNNGMNICRKFNCTKIINVRYLFCPEHWRLVPEDVKKRINKYGRYGTKEAYNQAVHDAIEIVNEESRKRNLMGINDAI
tara:strand:- start:65 stop:307 length:243 start_codon:yes stop_codon:yes gene_type:complete